VDPAEGGGIDRRKRCLREQRVDEADPAAGHVGDPLRDGRPERLRRLADACREERVGGRLEGGCGEKERLAGPAGQAGDPLGRERGERLRHGQRLAGSHLGPTPVERAADLERVERVPAARLLDPEQHETRERAAEPREEEPVERCQGERAERASLEPRCGHRRLQAERVERCAGAAHRSQHAHACPLQTTGREHQRSGRALVEPLRVVDRDEQRLLGRERTQEGDGRDRERPLVGELLARLGAKKRDLDRAALRVGQPPEKLRRDASEDVPEAAERELRLVPRGS
jgi:hypothetical protein